MHINFDHRPAAHCETGVTSNLLRFYHMNLSEAMVFGIGSGLYFGFLPFIKVNGIPLFTFRPWMGTIFSKVNRRLGVRFQRDKFKDPGQAMEALDKNLEQGIPTACVVGVFHLTYFPKAFRFHFNSHNIVVIGRENGEYLISDPILEDIQRLSYDDLMRVRFAKGVFAPKGQMYYLTEIPSSFDLKKAIVLAIRKTCNVMLRTPVPLIGARGIRFLARRMREWPEKLGPKKASLYLGQIVRMLEEIGTGGAGFRFIYAAFLQEAARELNQPRLNDWSREMTEAGDRWREFAVMAVRIFKNRAGMDDSYSAAANILMDIADREKHILEKLRGITLD
ncbi:MAG: BtrH N-terminal domain-containing protein [Deltaproteobacteria bacterium]|nr:BtrH N-terminal domain-containing protein [Deltaproteobacteria bacterium]